MSQEPVPRWILRLLVALAVVLLITIGVIWPVSLLLGEMEDATGAKALRYVALGAGILLAVDLIFLVLLQGLGSLNDADEGE